MTTLMCTCATPPEDARLLAFLDGEPDPELAADLVRCPSCRERLATLDVQQRSLMTNLRQTEAPSSLELGEYVLGLIPGSRKREIEEFLKESERGRADVAQLRAYLDSLKGDVEFTPLERVQVLVAELVRGFGSAGRCRVMTPNPIPSTSRSAKSASDWAASGSPCVTNRVLGGFWKWPSQLKRPLRSAWPEMPWICNTWARTSRKMP